MSDSDVRLALDLLRTTAVVAVRSSCLKAAIARDLGFADYAAHLPGRPNPFPLTP